MSIHSLSQNAFFKAITKPVGREAEALLAVAFVGVLLLTFAQSRDTPEYSDLPSDVTIETSDAEQNAPGRRHY